MLKRAYQWFHQLMHRPIQVFWICFAIGLIGVVLDGTAFRLWSLKRDHRLLADRINEAKIRSKQLDFRIQKSLQPGFIEKAARDQFDLVKEGDLIFIFSEENSESGEKTTDR